MLCPRWYTNFLWVFSYVLTFFGLYLPLSSSEQKCGIPKKMYAVFLSVLMFSGYVYLEVLRFQTTYKTARPSSMILSISVHTSLTLICVISILGNAFWNRERWSHYIKIQKILRSKLHMEKLWRKPTYFILEFFLGHIAIMTTVVLDQYRNFINDGTAEEKFSLIITSTIKDLLYYYVFLDTVVIYNTVLLLRKDFVVLKSYLSSSLNIQEIELFPLHKPIESVTSSFTITKDDSLKKLLEASKIVNILFECVEICNGIFGMVILLFNVSTVLVILSCLNRLLIAGEMNQLNVEIVAYNTSKFLIFLILNSFVTSACGLLKQEATSVINLCCKLQHLLPQSSKERQELLNLARQVSGKDSKISAAGFFDVDFSLIFSVFNYVGTYIVVLIQLSYIDF